MRSPIDAAWGCSALVPKPADWEEHIDVCGYFSLHEGRLTTYQPPEDLRKFLAAGASPLRTRRHTQ